MREDEQRSATEAALLSAVDVARADAKLVLLRAREIAVRSVATVCLALLTGFLLQAAMLLAVLVPTVRLELPASRFGLLVGGAVVVALVSGMLTYRSVRRLTQLAGAASIDHRSKAGSHYTAEAHGTVPESGRALS